MYANTSAARTTPVACARTRDGPARGSRKSPYAASGASANEWKPRWPISIRALKNPFHANAVAPKKAAARLAPNTRRRSTYVPRNPSAVKTTSVARAANTAPPPIAASSGNET